MSLPLGLAFPFLLVTLGSPKMHGLPCSSLGHCFGTPNDVGPDPPSVQETNVTSPEGPPAAPVTVQPEAQTSIRQHLQPGPPQISVSCSATYSARISSLNGIGSRLVCRLQGAADGGLGPESPRLSSHSASQSSEEEDDLDVDYSPEVDLSYPHIPRPSIIIRQPQVR